MHPHRLRWKIKARGSYKIYNCKEADNQNLHYLKLLLLNGSKYYQKYLSHNQGKFKNIENSFLKMLFENLDLIKAIQGKGWSRPGR